MPVFRRAEARRLAGDKIAGPPLFHLAFVRIAPGSQSWPVLGAGFKPVVRYLVSRVGSTPTGFRQVKLQNQNSVSPGCAVQFHRSAMVRFGWLSTPSEVRTTAAGPGGKPEGTLQLI